MARRLYDSVTNQKSDKINSQTSDTWNIMSTMREETNGNNDDDAHKLQSS